MSFVDPLKMQVAILRSVPESVCPRKMPAVDPR
jgi:hypothetical protein